MTRLLVLRESLKNFYARHGAYINPVLKFFAVFISLILIKYNIGYTEFLGFWPVMIVISILFAIFPWGVSVVGLAIVILIDVFPASSELAALVAASMVIMLLLFFRFTPRQGAFIILIPIAFFLRIPYVIPIAAGLLFSPVAVVSVVCGTIVYFMITTVGKNAAAIGGLSGAGSTSDTVNSIISMIGQNGALLLVAAAFSVTLVVVYLIRRTSTDHTWQIAIGVGGALDFVIVLIGALAMDIKISILWLILGTAISIFLAYVLQFFVFCVNYERTEHTQFEDDEYYYYVKAVPKISVSAPEMNVKRINAQRSRQTKGGRDARKKSDEK